MSADFDRVETLVSEKRVKLHVFEPSHRKVWSVVGRGEEHWIDPDAKYCSCPGYYFGRLNGKMGCYHLDSAALARKDGLVDEIVFTDDEFPDFILGLLHEL